MQHEHTGEEARPATLHLGHSKTILPTIPNNSIDSIVTDPPYELGFMGKKWDASGIAYDAGLWRECLRVLKPGGHLLSFGGSRTYHRMASAIEDAGFEIRDQIMWLYGQGFPKSHNLDGEWKGWGTALKPSHEPIVMARKPLGGTVAENVKRNGTGAINVDACRVATTENLNGGAYAKNGSERDDVRGAHNGFRRNQGISFDQPAGRWPANVIHDGSEDVLEEFSRYGEKTSGKPSGVRKAKGFALASEHGTELTGYGDSGSAARFFYAAKTSKADRGEGNVHPTVKPTVLMRYLCRLVTPPGGTVLDPFMGSGSTGKAALQEGFRFIGIEREPEYFEIAQRRVNSEPVSKHAARVTSEESQLSLLA